MAQSQSGTPVRNQRLEKYSIYRQTINGMKSCVAKVLTEYGKPQIPTVFCASSWGQREIQKEFGEVSYPYMVISPSDIRKAWGESYNPMLSMRDAKKVPISDTTVMKMMLVPVVATFQLLFVCQDFDDLQCFLESYLFRYKSMRFIIKANKVEIPIKLQVSDNVSYPEQSLEEGGNIFRAMTDITMYSYIGEIERLTRLTSQNLNVNISSGKGVSINDRNVVTQKEGVIK